MKKTFALLMAASMSFASLVPAFAAENIGVSPVNPTAQVEQIEHRTTSKPSSSETWNCKNEGTYYFSGRAAYDDLYTDYRFFGSTSYTITVANLKGRNDEDLKVTVYKCKATGDKKIGSMTVQGQKTGVLDISDLEVGDRIYIKFSAPSHFEGNITD